MSEAFVKGAGSAASATSGGNAATAHRRARSHAVGAVITLAALVAVGLRLYQLTRPGYLLGITEYDDGTDLGSAIRLVHGSVPYRDFIMVQPPGITILMAPVAFVTKAMSTATTMAAGRVLTALASAAAVPLGGLIVRHRGLLATIVTCGLLAVFPDGIEAAKTVLLEPWLVLFCLLGMLAVFDRDQLAAGRRRWIWGGLAFGFAGAVKVWAILPVLVILVMNVRRPRRAAMFAAAVAAGFLAAVLPFALTAPGTFYRSVIVAQLIRSDVVRIPAGYRLQQMLGLSHAPQLTTPVLVVIGLALTAAIAAAAAAASRRDGLPLPPLEIFAFATVAVVVIAFLWPADFYYHYAAFLAPFLAFAIALPASRLFAGAEDLRARGLMNGHAAAPRRAGGRHAAHAGAGTGGGAAARAGGRLARRAAVVSAALAVTAFAVLQAGAESNQASAVPPAEIAAAARLIPPHACVVTDQVSYTIAINRFISSVPGCSVMVDGVGSDYALSGGQNGLNGAGQARGVRTLWMSAFHAAQYAWLTGQAGRRIPWTPQLRSYFLAHFTPVSVGADTLYARRDLPSH